MMVRSGLCGLHLIHVSGLSGLSFQLEDLHFQRGTPSPNAQTLSQGSGGRGRGEGSGEHSFPVCSDSELVCLQGREEKHDSYWFFKKQQL